MGSPALHPFGHISLIPLGMPCQTFPKQEVLKQGMGMERGSSHPRFCTFGAICFAGQGVRRRHSQPEAHHPSEEGE